MENVKNELKKPTISIIVPVFNVKQYLKKCLDSLIRQTYTNVEIILVDDGSFDGSGLICDNYSKMDGRIQVIHQSNRGLAAARNVGLLRARGKYIGWVDSDDWIEDDMYEKLLDAAQKHDAEIALCGYRKEFQVAGVFKTKKVCSDIKVLSTKEAMEKLIQDKYIQNYVWNKLWKRELFEGIQFPEGHAFEDVATTYKLFLNAKQIVCIPYIGYNYLQRSGSIVGNTSLKNHFDFYLAEKNRYLDLVHKWPNLEDDLISRCCIASIGVWACYQKNPRLIRKKFEEQILEISNFVTNNRKHIQYSNIGMTGRLILNFVKFPYWWSFAIAALLNYMYKFKHRKNL